MVLDHPELPLHNNASELAVRRRVRKRDVSFGLPPVPVSLSPMQVRFLLRVTLPQPVFDRHAVVSLIAYQQRRKRAAYHSHRTRRLLRALAALPMALADPVPRPGATHDRAAPLPAAISLPIPAGVSL